jgi:hypothetical protein
MPVAYAAGITFIYEEIYNNPMAKSFENERNPVEDEQYYSTLIQDYGNTAMRLGVLLNRAKDDVAVFHADLAAHPQWGETITEYFSEKEAGLRTAFPERIEEMNSIVEQIKAESDPAVIKRAVNKLLMVIYPSKGLNQWFEGEEFSADKL